MPGGLPAAARSARKLSVLLSILTLLCALGAWLSFNPGVADSPTDLHPAAAQLASGWHLLPAATGRDLLVLDELSAPLVAWVALLYCLTSIATLDSRIRQFSFSWTLVSEAIVLATFACKTPWAIVGLLALGTIPPYLELRARLQSTRIYAWHMVTFVALLTIGWALVAGLGINRVHAGWAIIPLLAAVLIRSGIAPFHCWMTDLFEHATFGTALLFVTPIVGAYAAARLVLPIAPEWALHGFGLLSLVTVVYTAALALVQRDVRRFFCFIFLSHSSLVLVGLAMSTPTGLTGGLCLWLSVGLALCGFGLTLRALEARRGRLSLDRFQGLYDHTPNLAMCFGLTAFASIGFPGTFGFVGTEMLVDGAVVSYPFVVIAVVVAAAINGIAVVGAYFKLFSGTRYFSTVSLQISPRERYAVLTLAALILSLGLVPQPGVASRYRAAQELLDAREVLAAQVKAPAEWAAAALDSRTH